MIETAIGFVLTYFQQTILANRGGGGFGLSKGREENAAMGLRQI
jgi:hypothetical protein